jgi:hypothetical protein
MDARQIVGSRTSCNCNIRATETEGPQEVRKDEQYDDLGVSKWRERLKACSVPDVTPTEPLPASAAAWNTALGSTCS